MQETLIHQINEGSTKSEKLAERIALFNTDPDPKQKMAKMPMLFAMYMEDIALSEEIVCLCLLMVGLSENDSDAQTKYQKLGETHQLHATSVKNKLYEGARAYAASLA